MLERITYTNHVGETLEFGKGCLFVNENDLRDFAWGITQHNNRISNFRKGIVSKTIPVILACGSEIEGLSIRNRLFEVFEKDILAKQYGKIQIGEYYLQCYITGSKKTQYLIQKNHMLVSLVVQTDLPEWIKETTTHHTMGSVSVDDYLDFSYDFPYDFGNNTVGSSISNPHFVASNFIMTIYGGVTNPTLYINGHKYSVDVVIGGNDRLIIDSMNKTVALVNQHGEQVNCFNARCKDSYIFEKIPAGVSEINATNTDIRFDITLLEERSEPKWI